MLNRLFSAIKRGFRRIGKEGGYTLIEVTAVLAVTSVLAAVVIPIAVEKIKKGGETGAIEDCKYISAAIASFYADTGVWPAKSGATANYFNVLRSGPTNDTTTDPDFVDSGVKDTWAYMTPGKVDHLENHLVVDNPGGSLGLDPPNGDYRDQIPKADWKGPYIERMRRVDPWGKNYLVYVKGMHTGDPLNSLNSGWVLSAGPNLKVDTKTSDAAPQGDDIGVIVYRKRP